MNGRSGRSGRSINCIPGSGAGSFLHLHYAAYLPVLAWGDKTLKREREEGGQSKQEARRRARLLSTRPPAQSCVLDPFLSSKGPTLSRGFSSSVCVRVGDWNVRMTSLPLVAVVFSFVLELLRFHPYCSCFRCRLITSRARITAPVQTAGGYGTFCYRPLITGSCTIDVPVFLIHSQALNSDLNYHQATGFQPKRPPLNLRSNHENRRNG